MTRATIEPMTPDRLTVVGCGDAFGSRGRCHPCYLLEHGGRRTLLDCGASAPVALQARGIEPASIDAVALTHLHGDHFGGVPFLIMDALHLVPRTAPLLVAGPPGVAERVLGVLDSLLPGRPVPPGET